MTPLSSTRQVRHALADLLFQADVSHRGVPKMNLRAVRAMKSNYGLLSDENFARLELDKLAKRLGCRVVEQTGQVRVGGKGHENDGAHGHEATLSLPPASARLTKCSMLVEPPPCLQRLAVVRVIHTSAYVKPYKAGDEDVRLTSSESTSE
jgi:hypothetical protein